MSRGRMRAVVWASGALALGAVAFVIQAGLRSREITFSRDVAPITFRSCVPCHRPGQVAPFSLLHYADYLEHARDIRDVVEDRIMPPWKPVSAKNHFRGDRSLSADEIAVILRWIDEGKREGDRADLPALPDLSNDWQLGKPDLVVQLAEPYVLQAEGRDVYRNFVLPAHASQRKFVIGWELRPRSRAIHHAILYVDRLGIARKADAQDAEPGFEAMDSNALQSPDGFYLVWAPGRTFARTTDGSAWTFDASTELVLQLHLQPTGKREQIAPEIALYFSDTPPTRARYTLRLGDQPIDLPPGKKDYVMSDQITLSADVDLLGVFPHAHYLAKTMQLWATPPGGAKEELLRIDDWDFKWQDEYTYAQPPRLPAGSVLEMRFSYDNSADNFRNPSRPPIHVVTGERSLDEMGNVSLQVMPVQPSDLDRLREMKFRRELARNDGAASHYNLANLLARSGRVSEAIEHYQTALAKQPEQAPFHYNLAGLLLQNGQPAEAVVHLRKVIELRPDDAPAHVHLGNALLGLGQRDEGLLQLRRAVELAPSDAGAKAALERALSAAH